jgi:hypothetical protein
MKKWFLGLATCALFLALAPSSQAAQIIGDCTSPGADTNPPDAGSLPNSVCNTLPTPAGTINFITLIYKYDIALQLGATTGSVRFGHQINSAALSFFNNLVTPTVVTDSSHPIQVTMPTLACSGGSCNAALTALAAGVTIRTDFADASGSVSGVSADYAWVVDYNTGVPEPASMALVGLGVMGLGLLRKRQ